MTVIRRIGLGLCLALFASGSATNAAPPAVVIKGEPIRPVPGTLLQRNPLALAPAPGPFGATVVGTPARAHIAWQPLTGASGFTVLRWNAADQNCCRAQSEVLPPNATSWDDMLQSSGNWVYRVTALYPDGQQGFVDLNYLYPEPQAPFGLKAEQTAEGTVVVSWQPVKDASYYVLAGPPANNGYRVDGNVATITGVPPGRQVWQVATTYDAGGPFRAGSAFVSTGLEVVAHAGRYRLSLVGIAVTEATNELKLWMLRPGYLLNLDDGVGDELRFAAASTTFRRSPFRREFDGPIVKSPVFGMSGPKSPQRIQAGSARSKFAPASWSSAQGGITSGDFIPNGWIPGSNVTGQGMPITVWEGVLVDADQVVVVLPSLWEVDTDPGKFDIWTSMTAAAALGIEQSLTAQAELFGSQVTGIRFGSYPYPDLSGPDSYTFARSGLAGITPGVWNWTEVENVQPWDEPYGKDWHEFSIAYNIPGGIVWDMQQWAFVLTRDNVEGAIRSAGPAAYSAYTTLRLADVRGRPGDATLHFRLERLP